MEELIRFSRRYGADRELVIAGGGNTSLKENGVLRVKRSGAALSGADADSFIFLDMRALLNILHKTYPDSDAEREAAFLADVGAALLPGETGRPSVEALLHALFPQRYVLHLHPALINGLTCAVNGQAEARRLFGDTALWVPACRPGYTLAALLADRLTPGTHTVLLQNHGVFFAADRAEALDALLVGMLGTLRAAVSQVPELAHGEPLYNGGPEARRFSESREAAEPLMRPFTPDQVVYCGASPVFAEARSLWDGKGVAVIRGEGFRAATETALLLFEDAAKIAVYARSFGGPLPLSGELVDFIASWEAESYRKSQGKRGKGQ